MLAFDTRNVQLDVFTGVTLLGALIALTVFGLALHDWHLARPIVTTRVEDTTTLIILIVTGTSFVAHSAFCFVGMLGMLHIHSNTWFALGALLSGALLDIVCLPLLLWLLQRMRRSLQARAALQPPTS